MFGKPACIKCEPRENSNGLFTCHGCQGNFCSKHSVEHTDELRNRFEEIINQYNTVKDIFDGYKEKFNDVQCKLIAELGKEFKVIKDQIDQCQKTPNYSEQELDQWIKQLNQLKNRLTSIDVSPSFLTKLHQFLSSKRFQISLIILLLTLVAYGGNPPSSNIFFTQVDGPITLSNNKDVAEHTGPDFAHGSVRIDQIYSKYTHHVRFALEQISSSSNTFIGIIEASSQQPISSLYGWYIEDNEVIDQKPEEYRVFRILKRFWSFLISHQPRQYFRRNVQSGDILKIELDCTNSTITLQNRRTGRKHQLDINLKQSPLPWQIIFRLDRHGDRYPFRPTTLVVSLRGVTNGGKTTMCHSLKRLLYVHLDEFDHHDWELLHVLNIERFLADVESNRDKCDLLLMGDFLIFNITCSSSDREVFDLSYEKAFKKIEENIIKDIEKSLSG